MISKRTKTVLVLAIVAMAAVALTASPASAAVMSIDFDRPQGGVQSGEPTHHVGMTLPGQVGDWYQLLKGSSGSSPSITTPEGTLTVNTTGAAYRAYNTASNVLREDFFWLTSSSEGPITWTLTDLTPNGVYDIICYGRYDPAYGGYRGGDMSIVGYNGGSPVAQEHGATVEDAFVAEGDWNFPSVTADGTGTITGIFAWGSQAHAEWGGIQFQEVPEPATMIMLAAGLPALLKRRRSRS